MVINGTHPARGLTRHEAIFIWKVWSKHAWLHAMQVLMREAINGNQWQSVEGVVQTRLVACNASADEGGHQWQSVAISGRCGPNTPGCMQCKC